MPVEIKTDSNNFNINDSLLCPSPKKQFEDIMQIDDPLEFSQNCFDEAFKKSESQPNFIQ